MTNTHDWLPSNHEALYDQAMVTWMYLQAAETRTRMGLASSTAQGQWFDTEFAQGFYNFQSAFEAWKDPAQRTPIKIEKLKEAESVFRTTYRKFYTGFLKESPLVMDDDLVAMGMPSRTSGHVPAPVATTYPDFDIDSGTIRRLSIHFYDQGKKKTKAKPKGQHGAEIRWAILDAPPTKINDLINSSFDTRSPLTLDFEENQRGKNVYFCLRWENTRGEKGPWSEIIGAIIP
ncbi:MAG: hypothetical protein LBE12_15395 [Planctomycetaceae bacterium]|jgi:hypothetical protein|nr:hypothetical protein [Planctomycetaceae bacterium]